MFASRVKILRVVGSHVATMPRFLQYEPMSDHDTSLFRDAMAARQYS